ncbi:MAG: phosphatidate cytidylyltransferase, partial [Anaerolineaceae bacterium]|nr:phosphatidate cytidylyltransferase [Anaerolineaceae bacterium]
MLRKRLQVIILMVPAIVGLAVLGGWIYALGISAVLGVAAWEFWCMFQKGGFYPSKIILIGGTVVLGLGNFFAQSNSGVLISLIILCAMTAHIVEYERGRDDAAVDFCITIGGFLYIGWLGSHMISIRYLSDGLWWLLVVLPAAWFADSGGYVIGRWIGRHKFAPRSSPKKTWEGYFGGIVFGLLGTGLMGALWHLRAPEITFQKGLVLGAILAVITPLGDLGESIF